MASSELSVKAMTGTPYQAWYVRSWPKVVVNDRRPVSQRFATRPYSELRSLVARSTHPSDVMREARPSNDQPSWSMPVFQARVRRWVPKDPPPSTARMPGLANVPSVFTDRVAPKAAGPLVLVPTPLWICNPVMLLPKSGRSTQNTPCDSASFNGTPLMVTLMRLWSTPRMRREV